MLNGTHSATAGTAPEMNDVTASDKGPDGRPLFQSKLIGLGESTSIDGTDKLQSGKSYGFYCSVHPGMKGTIQVQ